MIHRRSLLVGLGALIAAPAIVRASSLMPVQNFEPFEVTFTLRPFAGCAMWTYDFDTRLWTRTLFDDPDYREVFEHPDVGFPEKMQNEPTWRMLDEQRHIAKA